jgi:AcrR family transcriptional regulator
MPPREPVKALCTLAYLPDGAMVVGMAVTREATAEIRLRSQRERLLAAAVEVVAERGYEATRVEDLLTASGVSRNTFYKVFANKHECFLAAVDGLVELAGPAVLDVYAETPGSWEERTLAMLEALGRMVANHPAAARICWIEAYAAGDDGVRRVDRIDARTERIVRGALGECPLRAGIPPEAVRALIGGLRKMIHTRLREGREAELPGEIPEIFDWMLRYRTPAERLRRPRRVPEGLVPPAPPAEEARDRILGAVAELVAEQGYQSMAITEIANRAAVSLTTFYELFDGKEEAFLATMDHGLQRAIAAVMPVYRAAEDWPRAVAAGLHAFFALFAADAALGRLAGIGVYESGLEGMGSLDNAILGAQALLRRGFELHPDTPPVAAEAIGTSIYALMSRQVRRRGAEHLYEVAPTAAFIALAPFVGSEEAAAVANAEPA